MKIKLAIFDLDGTLFDTSSVNYEAYRLALKDFNIELDEDFFKSECNGKHYKQYLPLISCNLNTQDMEHIHDKKKVLYKTCLYYAVQHSHLFDMIKLMRTSYYTAIVTTASRLNCEEILNYFNCKDEFDLILTQEDVSKMKPNPEGFLKAMQYFDIHSSNTIIFEDSDAGVAAAIASGASVMRIINIKNG